MIGFKAYLTASTAASSLHGFPQQLLALQLLRR